MSSEINRPEGVSDVVWDEHQAFVASFRPNREREAAQRVVQETVVVGSVDDYTAIQASLAIHRLDK